MAPPAWDAQRSVWISQTPCRITPLGSTLCIGFSFLLTQSEPLVEQRWLAIRIPSPCSRCVFQSDRALVRIVAAQVALLANVQLWRRLDSEVFVQNFRHHLVKICAGRSHPLWAGRGTP